MKQSKTHTYTLMSSFFYFTQEYLLFIYIYILESMGGYSVSMVGELQRVNEREIYIY